MREFIPSHASPLSLQPSCPTPHPSPFKEIYPMRDLTNNLAVRPVVNPAVLSTDTNGTGIDLQGFDGVDIIAALGAQGVTLSGSVFIDFILQHSDDNTSFAAAADADIIGAVITSGSGIFARIDANAKAARSYSVGYRGSKRYVRVVVDFTGTHGTGTPISVTALCGYPVLSPTV